MTAGIETLERTTGLISNDGALVVISAVAIILAVIGFLKKMKQDDEIRKWEKERIDRLDEYNQRMIEMTSQNVSTIAEHDIVIRQHGMETADNFRDIKQELKVINSKIDDLYTTTSNLATRQELDSIKQQLREIAEKL